MSNEIKETVLGGWKGSAVFALFCLFACIVQAIVGDTGESLAFFIALCGWGGWSTQEKQHLQGDVIKKRLR